MTTKSILDDKNCAGNKFNFLEDQTLFKVKSTNMDALTRLNVHASLLEDMISQEKLYRVSRYITMALLPKIVKKDEPMDQSESPPNTSSATGVTPTPPLTDEEVKANALAAILSGQLQDVAVPFISSSALVLSSPKK